MSEAPKRHNPNIMRHSAPANPAPPISPGDPELISAVEAHVSSYAGPVDRVFHEIVSPEVHLDVHRVPAGGGREHITLFTSGSSERAMNAPAELADQWSYAELLCMLPAGWRLDESSMNDERWYFPIRWLKTFARLPHQYNTWIHHGHSMPNGDPPEAFAPGVPFCGVLLLPPYAYDPKMFVLELPDRVIHFWMMVPLLREEMQYKLEHGMEALEAKLDPLSDRIGMANLFDPKRPSACEGRKKWFGLF